MDEMRSYRRRGTPDLPVSVYLGKAGVNMRNIPVAEYHPEIELTLIIQGSVTMHIGGVIHTFTKDDIFIISANTVHGRLSYTQDTIVYTLVFFPDAIRLPETHFFQREFVQPLVEGRLALPSLLQPGHPAYDGVYAQMVQLPACRIYEKNYKQNRFAVVVNLCLALMPHCDIFSGEKAVQDPGNEAVKLCMRYIHNNHSQKVRLEDIAEYCHLHPNYLCAIFNQYTGETIFAYLTRIRVETAAELICKEDLPVSKIAELVGFPSECLFYRKFNQIMGTTPRAYAKQRKTAEKPPV